MVCAYIFNIVIVLIFTQNHSVNAILKLCSACYYKFVKFIQGWWVKPLNSFTLGNWVKPG